MSSDPAPHRQRRRRRTSETRGRTPADPPAVAPSGSNRRLARASLAEASQAGSTAAPSANTAQKIAGEPRQSVVHDRADRPQRMILPNPSFKIDVAEQRPDRSSSPRMIRSPHPGAETESQSDSRSPGLLQHPARGLGQRRETTADLIVAASTGGPPHCTDRSSRISCFSAGRSALDSPKQQFW